MSNRANASQLQDGPTAGQGQAISDGTSAFVIAYLNREINLKHEKRMRICERNSSADTKVSAEGGGGGARDARADIFPLQPVEQTMVRQAVSLQPMEFHGGADLHL